MQQKSQWCGKARRALIQAIIIIVRLDPRPAWYVRTFPDSAMGVLHHAEEASLATLPNASLAETSADDRVEIARLIAHVATWSGFGASVATKLLHKKRPALIPILDNQAIFGAYMAPAWPAQPAAQLTVKDESLIRTALDWIACDLTRSENVDAWRALSREEPGATLIEIFDMVWWQYFRNTQPVKKPKA